jgi:hypothetical protein
MICFFAMRLLKVRQETPVYLCSKSRCPVSLTKRIFYGKSIKVPISLELVPVEPHWGNYRLSRALPDISSNTDCPVDLLMITQVDGYWAERSRSHMPSTNESQMRIIPHGHPETGACPIQSHYLPQSLYHHPTHPTISNQ